MARYEVTVTYDRPDAVPPRKTVTTYVFDASDPLTAAFQAGRGTGYPITVKAHVTNIRAAHET
jgi:hypothetical protein